MRTEGKIKFSKIILFAIVSILLLKGLEILLDRIIGNGDDEITVIRYLQALIIGACGLVGASRLNSKVASNAILAISSIMVFITLVELIFHVIVNLFVPKPAYTFSALTNSGRNYFTESNANLGYKAIPLCKIVEKEYLYGKEIRTAEYNIDNLSRRIGCTYNVNKANKKYACFMGCSFTFGYLVNDLQTLPCNFAKFDTQYVSYNYGLNGYGTQQLLSLLQTRNISNEIEQKNGVFIYTFIDHHIRRVIGDQFVMETNEWAKRMPYYDLENDSLILRGNLGEDRPVTNWIYSILNKSYFLRYFGIKFPVLEREKYFVLTGKMIGKAYQEYKKQFGNENFYVLIYPGSSNKISKYLDKGIKVLDYSKLYDANNSRYLIAGDIHPTPEAYELVAKQLAKDISK